MAWLFFIVCSECNMYLHTMKQILLCLSFKLSLFVLFINTWFQLGHSVSCMTTLFPMFANHQTNIRSHVKSAVNLVNADSHLIFLRALCGYAWVHILTITPKVLLSMLYWSNIVPQFNVQIIQRQTKERYYGKQKVRIDVHTELRS